MKFAITFVLFLTVSAVLAEDSAAKRDYEKRMQKAKDVSMNGLYEFLPAYKHNDGATLKFWTEKILEVVKSGEKHSQDMMPKMAKLVDLMNRVSEHGLGRVMKGMAWFMDGKRDNKSYADLEACILWTKERIDRGVDDDNLASAQVKCKKAQDALQLMAGTLVEAVSYLHKDVSNMREVNSHVKQVFENNRDTFLDNFAQAVAHLESFRDEVASRTPTLNN